MIITARDLTLAAVKSNSYGLQTAAKQDETAKPVEESSKVSLSSDGLRAAADAATGTDGAASSYRVTGPIMKFDVSKAVKIPDALAKELATRMEEEKVREEINFRYAYEHQYKTVGQVLIDGKFFAEVNEAGGYGSMQNVPGLSQNPLSPQERVEEIARAVKGRGKVEIRYSDFVPGLGGWCGPSAPESMLPPFTARSRQEIFHDMQYLMTHMPSEPLTPLASTST
ncbi:hypothetical protein EGT07_26235 [Herbaspirillum sp. HC18]|nr:hypothetical protein EGT07_26235 [Herbaspirillum sp. HC18]